MAQNKCSLKRDRVAGEGVEKGRVGEQELEDMSHLELIGITKSFQEDQEEARRREEETRTTRGETEKKWR